MYYSKKIIMNTNTKNQFRKYSNYYDTLYEGKPYKRELQSVIQILRKKSKIPFSSILSLGCGTGTYEAILAKKGYSVTGVDQSREMLRTAELKFHDSSLDVKLVNGDVRNIRLKKIYDAVIALFNIAGYQNSNRDVDCFMRTASSHLKKGGLFIFDVWYLPAVLKDPPKSRRKVIPISGGTIIRETNSKLDSEKCIVDITFTVTEKKDKKVIRKVKENHPMRFFTVNELDYFFSNNGLRLAFVKSFPDIKRNISEDDWNIVVAAEKL